MNSDEVAQGASSYSLPDMVITRADLARLLREVEQLDSDLEAIALRAGVGVKTEQMPRVSENLSAFLALNQIDLKEKHGRSEIIRSLRELKDDIVTIHLTFAGPADQESLTKLTSWVRHSVSPRTVIEVGLQPNLIAGVMVRTENQVHDFSLRNTFRGHADFLVKELESLRGSR